MSSVFDAGTIFIEEDLITENDPSSYRELSDAGTGFRVMFDRRTNDWESYNAYLFIATLAGGFSFEVQVNPEFGTVADARDQAAIYAEAIGRLPAVLLKDIETVWIHQGVQPFGGGNNNILIHTGQAANYVANGILEETLVHEATHTSLDAYHAADPGWLQAQTDDGAFISPYAEDFPAREDLAESFLMWMALRYLSKRTPPDVLEAIEAGIPNRIAYLDSQNFDMSGLFGTGDLRRSDFNGDGTEDILFFNPTTRAVGQFVMPDGDWSSLGVAGIGWEAVATGDLDGDQSGDVIWFNAITKSVGRFDMEAGQASWDGIGKAGGSWEISGTGDFDGDGDADILWTNADTNSAGQYEMDMGAATWRNLGATGNNWSVVGTGDFNDDGTDDILWFNDANGTLGQFRMSESGKAWSKITTMSLDWSVVATGDFNGDGSEDILVFNETARKLGQFDMADGTPRWLGMGTAGTHWQVRGSGDYDGDGRDDVLWLNSQSNLVGKYIMNGSAYEWAPVAVAGDDWELI